MSEIFHWVIFLFHLSAALIITFAVWLRCDPDLWVSKLHVDTYKVQANSSALWWYDDDVTEKDRALLAECSRPGAGDSDTCFYHDLPLYEKIPSNLGWHLFALLGHFEWISSAFAYFYIKHAWHRYSWIVSSGAVFVATLIFMPFRGSVFVNEVLLFWVNLFVCVGVFYGYRDVYKDSARVAPEPPQEESAAPLMGAKISLTGVGTLVADTLRAVELPALRYCEYCITAAELWIAVLCVFVQDPPAFMTIGGYTLILLTNLYGVLLHYSLVSDEVQVVLAARAALPRPLRMRSRGIFRVPPSMLGEGAGEAVKDFMIERRVWGSFIASNSSTMLNSWLAYLGAMSLVFYQQSLLFSSDAPGFIVFAGWSLIVTYTSFGIWVTLVYWFPKYASKICWFLTDQDAFVVVVYGLDVLSLAAKLSIVGSLSYGFVFRAEGRC